MGVNVKTNSIHQLEKRAETESEPRAKDTLITRLLRWIYPDQRNASRQQPVPPLIAYLGAARSSPAYGVGDISAAGFYMLTHERWLPGTEMPVTLQRADASSWGRADSITVPSTVVRLGEDGVGFSFPFSTQESPESANSEPGVWANQRDLDLFLQGLKLLPIGKSELDKAS